MDLGFDPLVFNPTVFFAANFVGPEGPPKPPPRRGTPINAYKQFKFIDRNGNTYYLKKENNFDHG